MTIILTDDIRAKIIQFLPSAIHRALSSYHEFIDQTPADDAKGFSAHHTACKAAIAHIDLLLKLAKWADLPGQQDDAKARAEAELSALLSEAEAELQKIHADGF